MSLDSLDASQAAQEFPQAEPNKMPWGTYVLSSWVESMRRYASAQENSFFGRRAAFFARRLALSIMADRADVVVFGHRLRVLPKANLAEKRVLFTPQFFDEDERSILAKALPLDAIFIDVGANVGAYSFFAASVTGPEARIIAIEPQPAIFQRLIDNISFNPGSTIEALPVAVADVESTVRLFVDNANAGETSMRRISKGSVDSRTEEVKARPLLQLVRELQLPRIDALKVDVEGAEDLVLVPFLKKAPDALFPRLLILENSPESWQTDCVALALSKGYQKVCQTRLNVVLCLPRAITD
ncbi:MAG: FkbM family methyltransferase [Pseudomonadota bacterium]